MKKLAIGVLVLGLSGAAYAGDLSLVSRFSLAIGQRPSVFAAPRVPSAPEGGTLDRWGLSGPGAQASTQDGHLAEFHLGRLSRSQKTSRMVRGGIMMAIGAVGIGVGAAMTGMDEEDAWFFADLGKVFGYAFIVGGSALAIGGIFSLAFPSEAERDYRDAMKIEDPEQRERACRLALPELAKHGRRIRIIEGLFASAFGVVALAGSGGDAGSALPTAAVFGGLAAYSFLSKSSAERALRSYNLETGQGRMTQLAFGVGPHGSVQATLLVSY